MITLPHTLQWTTPAPLWPAAIQEGGSAGTGFRRPALLRFATDTFMDEFLTLMENEPQRLGEYVAQPETWYGPTRPPELPQLMPPFRRALDRRIQARKATTGGGNGNGTGNGTESPTLPLKLYQPGHQRFYLVSSCLVCRQPGLPDRALESATQDRVTFVVRRLGVKLSEAPLRPDPDTVYDEYALTGQGPGASWVRVDDPSQLAGGEEQQPMFGINYIENAGYRRRVFAGLVPVGRREAYLGAPVADNPELTEPLDDAFKPLPGYMLLPKLRIIEPWKGVVARAVAAYQTREAISDTEGEDLGPITNATRLAEFQHSTRSDIQLISWYIMLDLIELFRTQLKPVWQELIQEAGRPTLTTKQSAIVSTLTACAIDTTLRTDLLAGLGPYQDEVPDNLWLALRRMTGTGGGEFDEARSDLEAAGGPYSRVDPSLAAATPPWPTFLFPLSDLGIGHADPGPLLDELLPGTSPSLLNVAQEQPPVPTVEELAQLIANTGTRIDVLAGQLAAALEEAGAADAPQPPPPIASQTGSGETRWGWFVIRCVYERPGCGPELAPARLSDPTEPFQMAGFFDPDAPARPIRIALPVDISPAGLRKFDRNTAFVMSDLLCGQVKRARGLSLGDLVLSVLPWPFHKDLPSGGGAVCAGPSGGSIGVICSLSIPIITIVALILLMIFVSLFDIIFHWFPFFIMCFPLPNFKAKENSG